MPGDWSYRGDAEGKRQQEEQKRMRASSREFWLKPGAKTDVVFLEDVRNGVGPDASFSVFRHYLRMDDEIPIPVTCTRDMEHGCEVCRRKWKDSKGAEKSFKRDMYMFASIVDLSPYMKDGKPIYATKRILAMRQNLFERLCGKSDRRRELGSKEGLKMWAVNIRRVPEIKGGKDVSWKTGNEFEPTAPVTDPYAPLPFVRLRDDKGVDVGPHPGLFEDANTKIDVAPFNYREVLAPPSAEEIVRWFKEKKITCGLTYQAGGSGGPEGPGAAASASAKVNY